VELRSTRLDGWGKIGKRGFDIMASCLGLVLLLPLALVVGILIKLDGRGPVLVGLTRVGLRGKAFTVYKFRSMVVGAHERKRELLSQNERSDGPLFKITNDPRITRIGKWLRASSIDELPQLWNVCKGDMSLVGPRPHEPEEVALYQTRQRQLLFIRPGMTGMAQVSGRAHLSFAEEAKIDMFYVQHWSFLLDLIILIKTPLVVLQRTGV
jgi:lipopolysaccharide/colanic/teichoic acid biosynthesis glycosyltransferase